MDHLLSIPTLTTTISILILSTLVWIILRAHQNQTTKPNQPSPPEPSGALPLIGHLHLLKPEAPLAHTLASFTTKYGPIFTIRLGAYPALVVSSQEAVKDCFTTNDKILASRPKSSHGVHLGYNFAGFGFAPYGPYWRKLRKIVMLELLSARRVESLKFVYETEIDVFIRDLYSYIGDKSPKPKIVISEWLERLTVNIITRMIAGKRYFGNLQDVDDEEARRVVKLIKDFMHISGEFVPSDLIPILGWFPLEGKVLRSMKRIARDLDSLASSWVEEHRVKKKESNDEKQDFIDFMLNVVGEIEEEDSALGHSCDTIIKANILSLILAGADTTSINMTWMLALLLNNKHVLKRGQEEIDLHVGKQRRVQASDIKNLNYLEAILKETLRLYPPGPLLVPHEATQDCYISGYYVPKGTRVLANVWKLHRDPTIWSQPDGFVPERFMTTTENDNGEINDSEGRHFQYLPFGYGRTACPGSNFGVQVSLLTLARLLQGFELEVENDEKVDMREGTSFTLPKATPLGVIPTPRLSPHQYH